MTPKYKRGTYKKGDKKAPESRTISVRHKKSVIDKAYKNSPDLPGEVKELLDEISKRKK